MTRRIDDLKSLLLGINQNGSGEPSSAIGYALALAAAAQAHLFVVASSRPLRVGHVALSDTINGLVAAENSRMRQLAKTAADAARLQAGLAGVACTAETIEVDLFDFAPRFVAQCRVHDLAIVDLEPSVLAPERGLIEQVLLQGGKPLLLVPSGCAWSGLRRMVLAWDGSASAARAVTDSLPFLKASDHVEVLCIIDPDETDALPGADLAPMLTRHEVEFSLKVLKRTGPVSKTLLDRAIDIDADLIVAGAYHHTRAREWLFGGVTQTLLKACPVPLLLSH